jgi:hypothetical protein
MTINQAQFSKIVETAKAKVTDKRWINAIDRAVEGLNGGWIITELANSVAITTESGQTYFANGTCSCPAYNNGQPCKHRALYRLLDLYHIEERESVTPKVTEGATRGELISSIKETWSSKFPTLSLGDELMKRFKRNSLEMLSIDFLVAVRAAIA